MTGTANWLVLIVVGIVIYVVTLLPPYPPAMMAFTRAIAYIFIGVGLLLLLLGVLGVALPR